VEVECYNRTFLANKVWSIDSYKLENPPNIKNEGLQTTQTGGDFIRKNMKDEKNK